MKEIILLLLSLIVVFGFSYNRRNDALECLKSLVDAERAFAKLSETQGMREAFMTYLAESSIVFRPVPKDGRNAYANSPTVPGMLLWQPAFADIAMAGDIGYTTGPWEYRQNGKDDKPVSFGHYVSIWQKQLDDKWRVIIDVGISHAMLEDSIIVLEFPEDRLSREHITEEKVDTEIEKQTLMEEDKAFSNTSKINGFAHAFKLYSADNVRLFRSKHFPFIGKQQSFAALSDSSGTLAWKPMAAKVSRSGDLGYTFGISGWHHDASSPHPDKRYSYLRIWKKQADRTWKVVLDISNFIPQIDQHLSPKEN